ncbi:MULTISPECIES: disulfide bond formation protein B [unclassified Neisseria]|uniref:disulfide bond formation protein B n=1 Tax=unclassified Neisseria TaxID=2623750 RepID=UPI0026659942|nr:MULTISPECIES: disulfide bond formation protein B [unclassified Neisseria]MDO1510744.1 disulfide bond formation protein B [Neisseria sp. MVDL19-042950]MDO1517034.1 disulfide bond formation protein B [Neisseria sp. MVDL18-041461]MDO1564396.1 disulfide bond formation protein B [Neisseria sp. MVDL20-010259]
MNLFRKTLWGIVFLSVLTTIGSFYSQYGLGLNPCVLCILQRLAVLAAGIAALLAAFGRQTGKTGRTVSALLVSIPAVYGAGVAVYQLYLQSLPPGTAPSCGAPWTFRLRDWPLFDLYEPVIRGFGDCAVPDYFLGAPLPIWSVLYFGFVLLTVWFAWAKTRP